jgi:energy-coupling factor transporter ATP-binding protein EcfA2
MITNTISQLHQSQPGLRDDPAGLERALIDMTIQQRQGTRSGLARLVADSGKPLSEFAHNDYRRFAPHIAGIQDAFTFSATAAILAYHDRMNRNRFMRWLKAEGSTDDDVLSDEEFVERFGNPPWEVLNETAAIIGLDYTFIGPEGIEENLQYELKLRHIETGAVVTTLALSSGEKTLLALTLSLYSGSHMIGSIEQPNVLLLDEADATLHPSMIRSLLQVIQEVFVNQYGVRVILTTHSPTTVALAPEECLYSMRRSELPRLAKTTRDAAVSSLTAGISTLSVRIENKRMVFVESEHDEECYQELYRVLKSDLGGDISLEFVASGRGGQGNSTAVEYLVAKLRGSGKDTVWGIVDRDSREKASSAGILYNEERYSIENFALDPVLLAVLLLREEIVSAEHLGLTTGTRHFEIESNDLQTVIAALTKTLANERDDLTPVTITYRSGATADVPSFWLNTRGHDLEDRVIEAWPSLRRFNVDLDQKLLSRALADTPQFASQSMVDLLQGILGSVS